jgi:hypothetical protein
MKKLFIPLASFFLLLFSALPTAYGENYSKTLQSWYEESCTEYSDIYQHVPVLRQLAKECASVVEIGLRTMVSSSGILKGLSENPAPNRSYLGIDIGSPGAELLNLAKNSAEQNGVSFEFWEANDMTIDIPPTEFLFIDSLHTYCHLTYELETFSPQVSKYIAMHDTSAPWGNRDEDCYQGNYSEYPSHYDRYKRGLWPAVKDFLDRHPEWELQERRRNNHGFTILKRVGH